MMCLKYPEMVLVDVDGTLVDSVPDLAFCIDETMLGLDLPRRGEDAVRQWVGNGVERLVERALTNSIDGRPHPELLDRAMPIFLELYAQNTSKRSRLYPGVIEGLNYLVSAGFRLGSVTNKAERFTLPLLKALGIIDFFEIVVSGDTLPRKKPDPMPLLHAAQRLAVSPDDALMLGDSRSDVKAARAAGFQVVCVSYGYNHGEDIRDYAPDAGIDSMVEQSVLLKKAA
jgi:phosphoglycolate phosphatase